MARGAGFGWDLEIEEWDLDGIEGYEEILLPPDKVYIEDVLVTGVNKRTPIDSGRLLAGNKSKILKRSIKIVNKVAYAKKINWYQPFMYISVGDSEKVSDRTDLALNRFLEDAEKKR
jgi:hypothetical protein